MAILFCQKRRISTFLRIGGVAELAVRKGLEDVRGSWGEWRRGAFLSLGWPAKSGRLWKSGKVYTKTDKEQCKIAFTIRVSSLPLG